MLRKFLSILAINSIFLISSSLILAQSKNDWSAVENLVDEEVAVKTKRGTKYGIIKSVDSNSLVLRLAGKKSFSNKEQKLNRNDIKKVWRALLFVGKRQTGKGILIGAGVGAGIGTVVLVSAKEKNPLTTGAPFLLAVKGAIIGGVAGFFSKKKHRKRDLVYKR